ncbi:hypothetical protein DWX58_09585 [Pseudoflavonifractor sp. AF19-9AC]|uniref:hypothetical protein n=1 Tax=Pseudoflavonifractor sp. AF19-9AC TaxID=2292244 RepID=UPI000E49C54D|nr:hypothetical protein [Pseudoflavonifractor sp. AF19-9AC]RHR08069.1 hypothetical protein DWX58_09585 [Pseudoflavonifractor sp. AF19-9AC]
MKKYIIGVSVLLLLAASAWYLYYGLGFYVDLRSDRPVTTFMKTDSDTIYMERDGTYQPFEIRGVDLGAGIPGEWATDFAIDKETYLRWFSMIQELGANTIRVYTILHADFYNAFYEYNIQREEAGKEPLWLLHGLWVDDYSHNSHKSIYDEGLLPEMIEDGKTIVDIIHGEKFLLGRDGDGSGFYHRDVSRWVLGYILGVEWEASQVTYTNQVHSDKTSYQGQYMATTEDATPFEAALAQLGDAIIGYESTRYKQQRLVAFSNWPTTDPFCYSLVTSTYRFKTAAVNVEHIQPTQQFISGYFTSYHIYPYFPDFLQTEQEAQQFTEDQLNVLFGKNQVATITQRLSALGAPSVHDYLTSADYYDSQGRFNTYYAYLKAINNFHNIPVVISEYGVTTGRGRAQVDVNTGRSQGFLTEQQQGQYLIECYQDIINAGSAGSCLFSWQDEWFKRTWNTLHAVDLLKTPYWSDYQTNEQFYGLLTFDPGTEQSVCYVDGDPSEWTEDNPVWQENGLELSMQYDEKFLYFYVQGFDPQQSTLYIPLDTTPKSGSTYCENYDISFDRPCDFVIAIDGTDNSRVVVQERYEVLKANYWEFYDTTDPYISQPERDSPRFVNIDLAMRLYDIVPNLNSNETAGESYETGKLRHGNANPDAPDFDSLADFCFTGDGVEIRIPWQLLNFSNPSEMMIHDDYYEHYGIENLHIDDMYVGAVLAGDQTRAVLSSFPLKGWGKDVTYHERLKESYYILQDYWASLD